MELAVVSDLSEQVAGMAVPQRAIGGAVVRFEQIFERPLVALTAELFCQIEKKALKLFGVRAADFDLIRNPSQKGFVD